jgi:hypothetical protein
MIKTGETTVAFYALSPILTAFPCLSCDIGIAAERPQGFIWAGTEAPL